jgi:uncharacterized protein
MSPVQNNTSARRYEMTVEGVTAFVTYHRVGAAVSLDHTEVPAALGGKGVGSALAKGTLDLVRSEGLKVLPRCQFIASFIGKHPQYQDLLKS